MNLITMNFRHKWYPFFVVLVYYLSDPVFCSSVEEIAKTRYKRNVICYFGLTDLVKEALYDSLEEVRSADPLPIDNAWKNRLHDGVLKGLPTLAIFTDLDVTCTPDDLILFSTTLQMNNAEIWYRWTRWKLKGSLWMKAKEVNFDLEIRLNTTNGLNFEVTNSLITKMDDFEIGFKGLGLLNPVVRKILKRAWKEKASTKISLLLQKALEKKLTRVGRSLEWLPIF